MGEKDYSEKFALVPALLKDISPEGWLEKQLNVQKNGLSGHIEEIWSDLGPDSGWLGGNGESWERGPYYLDGLIPLAYLSDDENLKEKAQKWIEWMLQSQNEDGFFGPYGNNDWWPRIVALKAIIQYHSATEDSRVLPFIDRYLRYQFEHIEERPFEMWGAARGYEELLPIFYLYGFTREEYLLNLADIILGQSYNWEEIFDNFPYEETTHKYLNRGLFVLVKRISILSENIKSAMKPRKPADKTKEQIEKKNNSRNLHLFHETHSVNIAMAFKMPVLKYMLDGEESHLDSAHKAIARVMKYHGLTNHVFSGDEHLNGHEPTVGAELCLVAEYMHSLETMLSVTGDARYADLLEQVAYNAWPATFLEDMSAHQYVQQVNQIEASNKRRGWYDAFNESNIFGLEPNYGCCAANMHQGWPKLAGSILIKREGGVSTGIYAPCSVKLVAGDTNIRLRETTNYPFDQSIKINIEKIDNEKDELRFPIWLRVPNWCRKYSVFVNEESISADAENGYIKIDRSFKGGDSIRLELNIKLRYEKTLSGNLSIHYGALLMALPVEGRKKLYRGEEPFADWEIYPESEWRYAAIESEISKAKISKREIGKYPFGDADCAVEALINMAPAPMWRYKNGSAGPVPEKFTVSKDECKANALVPYGCTRLRIAEFPIAEFKEE